MSQLRRRLPWLGLLYALIEVWRLFRFRRLLKLLRVRRYTHKGASSFLAWAHKVLVDKKAPVQLDAEVFARYATESSASVGYGGGNIDWRRIYSWWAWGCGRPFDAPHDAAFHAELLECVGLCCQSLGLEAPPPDAPATTVLAPSPFGFGLCEVRATFKPLPLRATLRALLMVSRLALSALGFRRISETMPEGDLVCWTDLPRKRQEGTRRPVVFLHGLGLGNLTYLPLFCGRSSWRAGGCVLVELPCMTSSSSKLERMPQILHYADALGRLLREQLGYGDFEFDVVCHSLAAYLASTLANEGSPCQPLRTVLIDPVCFLDGVEVCSRFPFRTAEECREFAEQTVLFPKFLPLFGRRLLGRVFRQLVCRDIFTQYSVLRWNGTDGTNIFWRNESSEGLVCLSDDDHFVPSERVERHCAAHFPKLKTFHMPGKDHGSFVIEPALRAQLLERITQYLETGE